MIQAKLGDSIRLECNATGDSPLTIDWFREGNNETIEKHGNDLYDIHESSNADNSNGLSSYMLIRSLKVEDALLYKCLGRNEYGSSERLIKLIVLNAPEKPTQLRVRDVWSRSALITWLIQQPSNSRITNYTVQYWRKSGQYDSTAATGATTTGQKNHRREETIVDGLHSSALLVNLLPSLTYEVSVIAHNQVGRSEPSDAINVTTSEEEPSAPPTDVQVESRGSSSLFVSWKVPPAESLNGKLLGFYIGYRPRFSNNLIPTQQHHLNPSINQIQLQSNQQQINQQQQQHQHQQQQQQQQQLVAQSVNQHQSVIYSYKTADAIEGQSFYDVFLTNLKQNQEYEVTVRAFNKAGSGPDCHTVLARTNSAKLPSAPNLQVQKITSNSVTLRWTSTFVLSSRLIQATSMAQSALDILRYVLYYQLQGERDWYELTVASQTLANPNGAESEFMQQGLPSSKQPVVELMGAANELISSQANIHTLANLQAGLTYRIYVSAANDYGLGDPSNVVTVKTESLNLTSSAYLGAAQLDSSDTGNGLMNFWNQREHSMLYTLLSSGALLLALVLFIIYLIWQRHLKNRYTYSSASSSYPTSWTPAACDTIQSEYSVKRFSGTYGAQSRGAGSTYDEVVGRQRAPLNQLNQFTGGSSTTTEARLLSQQRNANQTSGTVQRPVLSSHYYQPADLISGTLQPHSNVAFSNSRHQSKPSATLNRNQNRQLPPIPYNTMTVRDTTNNSDAANQWHQGGEYRLRNAQQQ